MRRYYLNFMNLSFQTFYRAGDIILEVLTLNAAGALITAPVSTILAGAPAPNPAPANPAPANPAPVNAPPPSLTGSEAAPFTYTYTTTDVDGNTVEFTQLFTPTYQPAAPWTPITTGTVLNLASYTQQFGGSNAVNAKSAALSLRASLSLPLVGMAYTLGGLVLGGMLVL